MLRTPDLTVDPPQVEHPFQFALDPFQKHAIHAISKDENVLVTAKTGSGKTLVGEFQIYHSLKKGKRVFYTTPIKSLSNQKFHDLKAMYPSVGIITGDIKFCPQADIVIMTTEILKNLVYKKGEDSILNLSLKDVDSVIFDEVHYINDPNRGKVWEECLTVLPKDINLVLLSATIEKPEQFATWLGDLKQRPIHLISTQYRIVPLVHMLPNDDIVMNEKDVYTPQVYEKWYRNYFKVEDDKRRHKQRVAQREEGEVVKKGEQNLSFVDRMNKLIERMELPALFFVFSRKLCSEYAKKVSHDLLTSSETADVKHILSFHLHRYPELQQMSQYHELTALLQKGVAYHHSGILPVMKEIIEILFSKGFVKVLFATETFAVGINMPTKTVVFTGYRKYDGDNQCNRMLTTSEYIQMAGRAGRRGKDTKGLVIYLPIREPEQPHAVSEMMTGKSAMVRSQMDFGYEYILATLYYGKDFQSQTYWMTERIKAIQSLQQEIDTKKKTSLTLSDDIVEQCKQRAVLEDLIAKSVNAEKRKYQSQMESWKNRHIGKRWDDIWKEYKVYLAASVEIQRLELQLSDLSKPDTIITARKNFLEETGYLEKDGLTQKGLLACQIHEGHPLLMSHLFHEQKLHTLLTNELVCALSMFLETLDEESQSLTDSNVIWAHQIAKRMSDVEIEKSTPDYWAVNQSWFEIVNGWMNGNDHVCEEFGIEYGNFVRGILKLANIVDEWVNMATQSQDVEMIEKCKDIRTTLVRGFVIPDSLYLRI